VNDPNLYEEPQNLARPDRVGMSRRMKTVLYIALGGILLPCGTCGGCFYMSFREIPGARKSADAFMDLIGQGRVDDAYAATAPAFRAAVSLERFREIVARYPAFTKQERRSMDGLRVYNGRRAIARYNVANAQNTLSLTLALSKVDGQWRVESVNLP
jgi:hypothetical protein